MKHINEFIESIVMRRDGETSNIYHSMPMIMRVEYFFLSILHLFMFKASISASIVLAYSYVNTHMGASLVVWFV
jgi:hypothetical protein